MKIICEDCKRTVGMVVNSARVFIDLALCDRCDAKRKADKEIKVYLGSEKLMAGDVHVKR